MVKVLFTLAIVVLALMWWFGKGRGGGAAASRRRKEHKGPAAQEMVACAHCGVHLPQPDAVEGEGGRLYCSPEHRLLGPGPRA